MELSIVDLSVRALLMAVGTGLVVGAFRIRVASARHRAWTAAMAGMLLLPFWTKWGPSVTAPVLPAEPAWVRTGNAPILSRPVYATAPRAREFKDAIAPPDRQAPPTPRRGGPRILLIVYMAGVAAMLVRLIRGSLQVRLLMRSVSRIEGLATSPRCAAPVTVGWLNPVLILPDHWRTWPAARLEIVLIHEREHVRRRDPLVQWVALLNRCVFWFHPLSWWLERKLAALAEDACDSAVLAGGHAPHDYARSLIEMARSVNQMGARIEWAGAVTFSSGNLPQRIRRIMEGSPETPLPRLKSIASVGLCAAMLATFLACSLGRPTTRVSDRLSMSERDRRMRADALQRQQQSRQRDESEWKAVRSLTPAGAKALEADLKAHPIDADKVRELVRYYQSQNNISALTGLTLWMIEQHPDIRSAWGLRPEWDAVWDKETYRRGRQLWTAQLAKPWGSPYIYMNAAEFLSGNDNEQAERALREGQRRFPATGQYSGLHWEVFLARHYAWALAGSAGQIPGDDDVLSSIHDESGGAPPNGPYASKVRENLLASKDIELLNRTVEQLQGNRPNREFCRSLLARVLSIEPDEKWAHIQLDAFRANDIERRVKTDPGSLSDTDRIVLLIQPPWFLRAGEKDAETKARDLLAIASRNGKDPNYGTAIFLANMALGGAAMMRGNTAEAVRHLLAASDAPPTEYLRYRQIDMSLPRNLIDAGERESVARFLDRCGKFNRANEPLKEWAAEIRKGLNPRLMPNFNAFRPAS